MPLSESTNGISFMKINTAIDDVVVPTLRSIGSVQLSEPLIKELLSEYYRFYHSVCPILPPVSSFIAHSDESPLLFWTVMLTAMRDKPGLRHLFSPLIEEVSNMAYDCIRPKNANFHSVQALLLLTYWNIPFEKIPMDPSFSFSNMATQICVRMGLHRPAFSAEFDRISAVHDPVNVPSRIVWIFCFVSNVSCHGQLGIPPTVRLDRGLLDALAAKPPWLPDTLYCQLHIAHHILKIITTLGNHDSSPTGLLPKPDYVVPMFEAELRVMETHLTPYWTQVDYIFFCTCKMVLYIIAISAVGNEDNVLDSTGSDKRNQWIVQGCMCAIAMIQATSTIQEPLTKLPTRIYKTLAASVSFLILLRCSKYYNLVEDSATSSAMRQGWELCRGFEIVQSDFITRTNYLMERLSIYSETMSPVDKTEELFASKARMGFNVARSTAVLVHRVVLKKNQENETTADNGNNNGSCIGQAADFNMDMADLDFFLDFDWDESLLSLPGPTSSTLS
ncbi:uncharacterized protein BHQ10_006351 [Talaromyces amestolkiae]|uniref:Xylanolytic transcriptional activator regulatory domain-containing protein n=1 Tax=Talaromyces amestolkiae TaxID=1196081 RepID=A0A364L3F1_TALAM|nr:uncharacterized protein BHQ10_006351 [Talaromyces amestolkiae]RAO70339.1 hypothetical protein BHQ10_006351 [Talaromyces amestolkiae]